MKVLVQRTSHASVSVAGEQIAQIRTGLLALVGIAKGDTPAEAEWMANKLLKLRIFEDDDGKMNRSVLDIEGEVLLVSQFTLCGDVRKGARPSFGDAMPPVQAKAFFEDFVGLVRQQIAVQTGVFQAHMEVSLCNDGPVTLMLERSPQQFYSALHDG